MMLDRQYNRLGGVEVGVLLFILLAAFRVCMMPAMLSDFAGESGFYVLLAGLSVDLVVTGASLAVAAHGGVRRLPVPSVVRRVLCALLFALFLFKIALRTYEVVDYCTGELFDHATPLLLTVVLVLTAAILAAKGFRGLARTSLTYLLLVGLLALLSVFFVSFNGYGYNLWPLLRPRKVGEGILRSMLWLGDGAVFLFADVRHDGVKKGYTWGAIAFLFVLVTAVLFYLGFISTYGSAGRYVRYAFVRLLTGGDPEQLGAVDWPVVLIWLTAVPVHLGALFYALVFALREAVTPAKEGVSFVYYALGAVLSVLAYLLLFRDKDVFPALAEARWLSFVLVGVLSIVVVAALFAVVLGRRVPPDEGEGDSSSRRSDRAPAVSPSAQATVPPEEC